MKGFCRLILGVALLPMCWGMLLAVVDALREAAGSSGGLTAEAIALIGGIAAFGLSWSALPHPVRAYVLGHELTHALWGLIFGARPSDLKVGAAGGSVKLTKTNVIITLAPYFFPFWTFVVIIVALITFAFVRPLPYLPLWMFLIGFTWAFHILFTLETLTQRQPDIKLYGRIFSWTFIFLVNIVIIQVWLTAMTPLTFAQLQSLVIERVGGSYRQVFACGQWIVQWVMGIIASHFG